MSPSEIVHGYHKLCKENNSSEQRNRSGTALAVAGPSCKSAGMGEPKQKHREGRVEIKREHSGNCR